MRATRAEAEADLCARRQSARAELATLIPPVSPATAPPPAAPVGFDWDAWQQRREAAAIAAGEPDGPEAASDLDSEWAGLRAEDAAERWSA